ncbi:MAG TPA: aminoacyl-tRNA hydrolase [Myxococcales bacterium]|nr:aminoacyl-tRNA hydrolase [Myxococcales bacterium]
MRLLVGLGNPGARYERTRHNVGFRIAQEAARKLGAELAGSRWEALVGKAGEVAVLLPQGFMNLSGEAVAKAARFWKVPPEGIVVAHDEIDLEFGRIQVKEGGGDAGHNGLRSIREHLGSGETVRLRFGVGRPPPQWEGADWVLARFSSEEEQALQELVPLAAEAAVLALKEGPAAAANKYNRRPRKEEKEEAK